jgi:hypothetical protein
MIDAWAELLGISGWYAWLSDEDGVVARARVLEIGWTPSPEGAEPLEVDAGELPAAIEPEQQAAARGDVRFFELIPEEVRSKVTTWSDFSDDWSVDGDFQNDTSQAFDVRAP